MMEFLRSMFLTPEAQVGAYPWASALAGYAFVGIVMMAVMGCLAWAFTVALQRLAVTPARRPSTYALIWTVVCYAPWEGAQMAFAGGGLWDGITDWVAVACGALIGWGAWRGLVAPIALGLILLAAYLVDGVTDRLKRRPR